MTIAAVKNDATVVISGGVSGIGAAAARSSRQQCVPKTGMKRRTHSLANYLFCRVQFHFVGLDG